MAVQLPQSVSAIVNNIERRNGENGVAALRNRPSQTGDKPNAVETEAVVHIEPNDSNTNTMEIPVDSDPNDLGSDSTEQAMADPNPVTPVDDMTLEATLAYFDSVFKCCPFCDEPATVDGDRKRLLVKCVTCNRDWCYSCEVPWHEGLSCMDYKSQVQGEVDLRERGESKGKKKQSFHLKRGECTTCLEVKAVWQTTCCQEEFCLMCLDTYLSSKVDEGIIDIRCPGYGCESLLDPGIIRKVVVSDKSKRLSFLRVKLDRHKNKKACPLCDIVLSLQESVFRFCELQKQIVCPECLGDFCFHCLVPWHKNLTCVEYRTRHVKTGIDTWARKNDQINQRNAQKCPNCKVNRKVYL